MKLKYDDKNKTILLFTKHYSILKVHVNNGLIIKTEHPSKHNNKIRFHYKISILNKLSNHEARRHRERRFKSRNAIVRIRGRLRLLEIAHWVTSDESRKKTLYLKTKSYIRIDICPPGELEIPARSWN